LPDGYASDPGEDMNPLPETKPSTHQDYALLFFRSGAAFFSSSLLFLAEYFSFSVLGAFFSSG
jgi:hypothetical protein